jgi:hypothetical protein
MFRDPALFFLQLALVCVPCAILATLGVRYARAKTFSEFGALVRALLWSLPFTWVLSAQGFGHGGFAMYFPAWWALGASLTPGPTMTIDYPSPWLTPLLPIVSFFSATYYARRRQARREQEDLRASRRPS